MIKMFCDKCGKELDKAFMYTGSIYSPEITNWDAPFVEDPSTFELCADCAKKLEIFLRRAENDK